MLLSLIACLGYDFILNYRSGKCLIDTTLANPQAVDRVWFDRIGETLRLNVKMRSQPLRSAPCLFKLGGLMDVMREKGLQPLDLSYPSSRR